MKKLNKLKNKKEQNKILEKVLELILYKNYFINKFKFTIFKI